MAIVETGSSTEQLRAQLLHLRPPYLLRYFDATTQDFDEISDEDLRCEYLDGVLIVHSPASPGHEERIVLLSTVIHTIVAARKLGRVFGSNTVMKLGDRRLCPDLSVLKHDHADRIKGSVIDGPMDLVIEMLSKSTRDYDLREKRIAYREARIPEIWFFDPETQVAHIDTAEPDGYASRTQTSGVVRSRGFPGLQLDVAWLWARTPPNPLDCLREFQGRPPA